MSSGCMPGNRPGYTLLELLIVLAILSAFATMVVPPFYRSYWNSRAMDTSVGSVMESILLAKQLAIQNATPYVYEFERGSSIQQVYPIDGSLPKQTRSVAQGIRLESASLSGQAPHRIIFREDGSTESFSMRVVGPNNSETIQVLRHLGIPQRKASRSKVRS